MKKTLLSFGILLIVTPIAFAYPGQHPLPPPGQICHLGNDYYDCLPRPPIQPGQIINIYIIQPRY